MGPGTLLVGAGASPITLLALVGIAAGMLRLALHPSCCGMQLVPPNLTIQVQTQTYPNPQLCPPLSCLQLPLTTKSIPKCCPVPCSCCTMGDRRGPGSLYRVQRRGLPCCSERKGCSAWRPGLCGGWVCPEWDVCVWCAGGGCGQSGMGMGVARDGRLQLVHVRQDWWAVWLLPFLLAVACLEGGGGGQVVGSSSFPPSLCPPFFSNGPPYPCCKTSLSTPGQGSHRSNGREKNRPAPPHTPSSCAGLGTWLPPGWRAASGSE